MKHGSGILVGHIHLDDKWPDGTRIIGENETIGVGDVVLFQKVRVDRSDIIPIPYPTSLVALVYRQEDTTQLIDFVNAGCDTYFSDTGAVSEQGVHRDEIRRSKFFVKNISDVQSKHVFFQKCYEHDEFCYSNRDSLPRSNIPRLPECEKIDLPSKDIFFHKYLKRSKPVLFKNVLKDWPAFTKWSNNYLKEKYGKYKVRFQLTPQGEYERIEPRNSWENYEKFKIPQSQADHMPTPDLVLVRPAIEIGNFSFFMEKLEGISNGSIRDLSVYLEYASIPEYLPELEDDLREKMLFNGLLTRDMLNLWLSDGKTTGKLHFDASDNFLCQVHRTLFYNNPNVLLKTGDNRKITL
jgi:jumonji domain-containing protein 7